MAQDPVDVATVTAVVKRWGHFIVMLLRTLTYVPEK